MTMGAGIALLGIWTFAAACAMSRHVTGLGMLAGVVAALAATMLVSVMH